MRILQASSSDIGGGAERIAWLLFDSYRQQGHESYLAVGKKLSDDSDVLLVPNDEVRERANWTQFWRNQHRRLRTVKGLWRLGRVAYDLAEPRRTFRKQLGHEDFDFPATSQLLDSSPQIFHAHNLHNGYFDLRFLPEISQHVPTILTLHDEWLLTGHCAYPIGCQRWEIGCGNCPDLTLYPAIKQDATAYNWRRKANIYDHSQLYISTPSQWLMNHVERSMLNNAAIEKRVIPYGVNLEIFKPADKSQAKAALNLPPDVKMLLFVGNRASQNPYKDYDTVRKAVEMVELPDQKIIFVALGDAGSEEQIKENITLRAVPYQKDLHLIAQYYQAADIFLHAALADNFPNTILEALACGTPVIATGVGGIPEQILTVGTSENPTGMVVPARNPHRMARAMEQLLQDDTLRLNMGIAAVQDAHTRFDLKVFVKNYLNWYEELLS